MNSLNFSLVYHNIPYLLHGLVLNLKLTAVGASFGIILGIPLALLQHFNVPILAQLARIYVAILRALPLIMVIFWFFFLVPTIAGDLFNHGRPMQIGGNLTAYITFSIFEAAYYSEIIRVGLRSVNRGQYEAANAISLSTYKTYRFVIFPQVIRIVSPIILTQIIILFQDTSLVYVMSLTDLVGAAVQLAQLNQRLVELYLTVAIVYLVICSSLSQLVAYMRGRSRLAGL